MQALLEGGHEALLAALQGLLVAHPILEAVEDPGDAGAQRLDGGDGLGKRLQVHAGAQRPVRHLGRRRRPRRAAAVHAGKCSPDVCEGVAVDSHEANFFRNFYLYGVGKAGRDL